MGVEVQVDIDPATADPELCQAIPISFAKKHRLIPLGRTDGSVIVAITDPFDLAALDEVARLLGASPRAVLTTPRPSPTS